MLTFHVLYEMDVSCGDCNGSRTPAYFFGRRISKAYSAVRAVGRL